jgi:hypothetical protein
VSGLHFARQEGEGLDDVLLQLLDAGTHGLAFKDEPVGWQEPLEWVPDLRPSGGSMLWSLSKLGSCEKPIFIFYNFVPGTNAIKLGTWDQCYNYGNTVAEKNGECATSFVSNLCRLYRNIGYNIGYKENCHCLQKIGENRQK